MADVILRDSKPHKEEEKVTEGGGQGWTFAATSRGHWEKLQEAIKDSPHGPPEVVWPGQHLHLRLVASRVVTV